MKVPLFPKHALGPVTLNGQIVSEGAVLNTMGTLLVDCGGFSVGSVRVFNGDTEWTPQAVSGRVQQYNIASDGLFTVRTSEGVVLLSFSVTIPQDFTLIGYYAGVSPTSGEHGALLQSSGYRQIASFPHTSVYVGWIQSDGVDIVSLPITNNLGIEVKRGPKDPEFDNTWLNIQPQLDTSVIGKHLEVYVGNVLVLYIENFT